MTPLNSGEPWSHYFQFAEGARFFIDGPAGYNGKGAVITRSATLLKVGLALPAWGGAPELDAMVSFEFKQDGRGNCVILEPVRGQRQTDLDATMESDPRRGERRISSTNFVCSIRNEQSAEEIDFDLLFDGKYWDFDLELLR